MDVDDRRKAPLLQKYDSNGVKGFVAMDEFIEVGTESTVDLRFGVLGTTCRRCTVDDVVVDREIKLNRSIGGGGFRIMKPPSGKCKKYH